MYDYCGSPVHSSSFQIPCGLYSSVDSKVSFIQACVALPSNCLMRGTKDNYPSFLLVCLPAVSTFSTLTKSTVLWFFSCPLYSTFLVLCVLCYHRDRRCSKAPGREWKQGFELTVPAGKKSPRQESIAVNGRRELCGPICLCVHGVLESTDAAKEALKMSCLQKAIFQRSQCSLEFHRNQTGYFICTKITEVTLTYSFCWFPH